MESFLSYCAHTFSAEGGVFLTFLIGGLAGGFTHCLAMCGPLVACERACAGTGNGCGALRSIGDAAGLSYQLGRFTTYGALGFLAALFSRQIAAASWWPYLSSLMLACAGALFLFSCIRPSCEHGAHTPKGSRLTYLRGALMGFMPCGLLYAALMMAATIADPLYAMFAMWLFALGTLPALCIASGGADLLSRKWRHAVQRIGRAAMAFNGLSLLVMAATLAR